MTTLSLSLLITGSAVSYILIAGCVWHFCFTDYQRKWSPEAPLGSIFWPAAAPFWVCFQIFKLPGRLATWHRTRVRLPRASVRNDK